MKIKGTIYFTLLLFGLGGMMYLFITSFKPNTNELQKQVNGYNYVIGTQTVGSKYKFTEKTMLVETALEIKNMGSNLLKFSMHPRYATENYGLPKNDQINSLTTLATLEPSVKEVLDMDFKYYHIWVYGFSQYTPEPPGKKDDTAQIKFINGYPSHYEKELYKELYEFTAHLLKTYNGSGKVFYLGNWEGDWHLRPDYDRNKPVNPKTLDGMKKWAKVRQKAIDDAKKNIPHKNIAIYHYIEVNLVRKAIEEPESQVLANSLLEEVNPDYVSYSSYDATNPYKNENDLSKNLQESLDYLESKLKPKKSLPKGKRVWIGEYGNPSKHYDDEMQNLRSVWTIKAALKWGAPYILYWELYNNEISNTTGEQVGYWLINHEGKKQPIWHTHHDFYKESKLFVESFINQNGHAPSFEEFKNKALTFKCLNPSLK